MGSLPVIKQSQLDDQFSEEVKSYPGAEKIEACIQCGTCTGTCPTTYKMDYTPRKLIAMTLAGMREEVLKSKTLWLCVSCYSCAARCPRGINITDIIYALKNTAVKEKTYPAKDYGPIFYRTFNKVVEKNGIQSEPLLMTEFMLKTNPFSAFGYAPLGIQLFLKGRLPLPLPPDSVKNKQEFRKMLAQVKGGRN